MTIDEEISKAAAECDAHFHHAQPELIAEFRAHGVSDADMPEVVAYACDLYEQQRGAALAELRTL